MQELASCGIHTQNQFGWSFQFPSILGSNHISPLPCELKRVKSLTEVFINVICTCVYSVSYRCCFPFLTNSTIRFLIILVSFIDKYKFKWDHVIQQPHRFRFFCARCLFVYVFIFTTTRLQLLCMLPWAALDSSESSFGGAINKGFFFLFQNELIWSRMMKKLGPGQKWWELCFQYLPNKFLWEKLTLY